MQSLKAAQPAKPVAAAAPVTAPAPAQIASVVPPAPVASPASAPIEAPGAAAQLAPPLPPPTPVASATLESPPVEPAVKKEASAIDILKTDPTVRIQPVPKDAEAGPLPHESSAKSEAAAPKAPAKKTVQAALPPKPATAPAPAPKLTTTAGQAPKLITASARTPSSNSAFYVQAGSFPTQARAGQAASALDSMGARVMSGTIDGHAVYRVRIGPFLNIRQANAAIEQAHALGHADLAIVTE